MGKSGCQIARKDLPRQSNGDIFTLLCLRLHNKSESLREDLTVLLHDDDERNHFEPANLHSTTHQSENCHRGFKPVFSDLAPVVRRRRRPLSLSLPLLSGKGLSRKGLSPKAGEGNPKGAVRVNSASRESSAGPQITDPSLLCQRIAPLT